MRLQSAELADEGDVHGGAQAGARDGARDGARAGARDGARDGARAGAQPRNPRTILLDGTRLAAERAPGLATRAAAVRAERGHPPCLALIAFADSQGRAPYAARKLRAAEAVGIDVEPLILGADTSEAAAVRAVEALLGRGAFDGVFIEFPFPAGIAEEALIGLIPEEADIDLMLPRNLERYLTGQIELAPLTIAAALELLDGYGIDIVGVPGLVVAEMTSFSMAFREAFARRGALMGPIVAPTDHGLEDHLRTAELVVVAAGRPGLIEARALAPGAVAIDAGYYNGGGRGDIDITADFGRLAAIAPVPGGIGPMVISALIERLIDFAEGERLDALDKAGR